MPLNKKHDLGDIQFFPVSITRIDDLGNDAYVLYFKRFFEFQTGQVVALTLDEKEAARLYSICSAESEEDIAILYKVNPTGFLTPRLAEKKVGDKILSSKAFGAFHASENDDYWIAAGTGIAPFVSMLKSGFGKHKTLIQGGREEPSFYFSNLFTKDPDLADYIPCSSVLNQHGFYSGRLTKYLMEADLDVSKSFFVCGSSEMVVQVRDILIDRGVEYEKIIAEIYF
jgi:ferredoxin--NADP+ reductase